jgi:hypothetical protein
MSLRKPGIDRCDSKRHFPRAGAQAEITQAEEKTGIKPGANAPGRIIDY